MVTAVFLFHGELNDFLAPARRRRGFTCACARAATVKHMVEALGVAHTEVGRVLIDGAPVALDRRLAEGECVVVHPGAGAGGHGAAGPAPRFLADARLGGLARHLRMAGFDTRFEATAADAAIVDIAPRREGRTVLSRDRELLKRRGLDQSAFVRALTAERQLDEVFRRFGLARQARPFSLRLACNTPLLGVASAAAGDRLPPALRARHQRFSTRPGCAGQFRQGSPWAGMCRLLAASGIAV